MAQNLSYYTNHKQYVYVHGLICELLSTLHDLTRISEFIDGRGVLRIV